MQIILPFWFIKWYTVITGRYFYSQQREEVSEIGSSSQSPGREETQQQASGGGFRKVLKLIGAVILFAAAVFLCTVAYIFKDSFNPSGFYSAVNSVKTYSLQRGAVVGSAETDISLVKDMEAFLGGLIVLGSDSVSFIDIDGKVGLKASFSFSSPALVLSRNYFIVYDRGGTAFMLFNRSKMLLEQEAKTPIYSMSVNNNGYFSVVSGGTGYRSVVSTYNRKGENLYNWYTSTYYVASVCVAPSGKSLSAVCMSENNGEFLSTLIIFDIDSETPSAQIELGNDYIFSICYTNAKTLALISESNILFFSDRGEPIGSYSFDGMFYAFVNSEGSPPVIATNKYSAGSFELRRFNYDGSVAYTCTLSGTLKHLSKYGKYTVAATDDTVWVLDNSLRQTGTPLTSGGLRGVFDVSDGIIAVVSNSYLHFIKI